MSSVLIVDDDARIRDVLSRWLRAAGHDTQEAADAEAALEMLDTEQPAVVLCDVVMPGQGGLWLVERARAQHPTIAMVLATGVDNVAPATSLAGNVVDYLVKPFERTAVLAAVVQAQAWHDAAVQQKNADASGVALSDWLRTGRSQASELK